MNTGLYIHIPFCASKCDYCDFLSFDNKNNQQEAYVKALVNELSHYKSPTPFNTIYIGGGTPTVLPSLLLQELLAALPDVAPDAEVTCEANPGTLDLEKIKILLDHGVNRVSLGLQAFQAKLLQNIGRKTTQSVFLDTFYALRDLGFNNINIDIMFALPEQSMADWEETLSKVVSLNPEHISAYALTPEEGTPIYSRYGHDICDDETDRQMYHLCKDFLRSYGYDQYEISNFAKPGFESRHNIIYWTRQRYIGLGLGAHSFDGSKLRWNGEEDFNKYLLGDKKRKNIAHISESDAMAEFMFLGLRMTKGISTIDFYNCFGKTINKVYGNWLNKMIEEKLLQKCDDRFLLTSLGMDLANRVMAGFLN